MHTVQQQLLSTAFVLGSTGEISIVNSYVAGIMPSVLTSDVVLGL
jgi:hypothetical protein